MIRISFEVLATVTAIAGFLGALAIHASRRSEPARLGDPVEVYAELDGVWSGTFVGYDDTGQELYRIGVRQEYRTVDANTQTVRVVDTMQDGTVITGEGENTAHADSKDGTARLRCVVRKSNGDLVEHDGRIGEGPDGSKQLFWYSRDDEQIETFREWVERDAKGRPAVYHIQGMGRYGETMMLMTGRYERQADAPRSDDSK